MSSQLGLSAGSFFQQLCNNFTISSQPSLTWLPISGLRSSVKTFFMTISKSIYNKKIKIKRLYLEIAKKKKLRLNFCMEVDWKQFRWLQYQKSKYRFFLTVDLLRYFQETSKEDFLFVFLFKSFSKKILIQKKKKDKKKPVDKARISSFNIVRLFHCTCTKITDLTDVFWRQ